MSRKFYPYSHYKLLLSLFFCLMGMKGYFSVTFISLTTSWIWKYILYLAAIYVISFTNIFLHILGILFVIFLLPICKNSLYIIDIILSLRLHYTCFSLIYFVNWICSWVTSSLILLPLESINHWPKCVGNDWTALLESCRHKEITEKLRSFCLEEKRVGRWFAGRKK